MRTSALAGLLMVCVALASCGGRQAAHKGNGAVMEFEDSVHDFGTLSHSGPVASYGFRFVNTGSAPVLVQSVTTSCQCSAADYSKRPIKPGGSGVVRVTLDPRKMSTGHFMRTAVVYSNARNARMTLVMRGVVR